MLQTILSRHCYRGRFDPAPVPREDLRAILEAGLSAPSGCNLQTTSFIAVDDPDTVARLHAVIVPPKCATAPAVICVLTQRVYAFGTTTFAVQDYSAAIENMLLAIHAMGYASCWIEGDITDTDRLCDRMAETLEVPEGYEIVCVLPVGRPLEALRERKKKPFNERAWFNRFGNDE